MTRPIYEPSLQRTDARLGYGNNQLFRRPAHTAFDVPYCWMRWVGSEAVPADTLFNPALDPAVDVPYEESFIYDPDGRAGFEVDRDTGDIHWGMPGEYYVYSRTEWNGTGSVGQSAGAVLDLGEDYVYAAVRVITNRVFDAINQNHAFPVDVVMWDNGSDQDTVRTRVYHDDAGGNDIGFVWIHAIQLNAAIAGVLDP